jgi:hypothetical protein
MTTATIFDAGLRAVTRIVDDGDAALVADLAPDGFATGEMGMAHCRPCGWREWRKIK